ncbi:MAG: hypothetical protein FWC56_06310 [Phycisphaerae bacterium]|nr:hypothetical protein [Phycisphaerae bacterium]
MSSRSARSQFDCCAILLVMGIILVSAVPLHAAKKVSLKDLERIAQRDIEAMQKMPLKLTVEEWTLHDSRDSIERTTKEAQEPGLSAEEKERLEQLIRDLQNSSLPRHHRRTYLIDSPRQRYLQLTTSLDDPETRVKQLYPEGRDVSSVSYDPKVFFYYYDKAIQRIINVHSDKQGPLFQVMIPHVESSSKFDNVYRPPELVTSGICSPDFIKFAAQNFAKVEQAKENGKDVIKISFRALLNNARLEGVFDPSLNYRTLRFEIRTPDGKLVSRKIASYDSAPRKEAEIIFPRQYESISYDPKTGQVTTSEVFRVIEIDADPIFTDDDFTFEIAPNLL